MVVWLFVAEDLHGFQLFVGCPKFETLSISKCQNIIANRFNPVYGMAMGQGHSGDLEGHHTTI